MLKSRFGHRVASKTLFNLVVHLRPEAGLPPSERNGVHLLPGKLVTYTENNRFQAGTRLTPIIIRGLGAKDRTTDAIYED